MVCSYYLQARNLMQLLTGQAINVLGFVAGDRQADRALSLSFLSPE